VTSNESGTDQAIEVVLVGPEWIVVAIDNIQAEPNGIVSWFVEPGKLRRWWGDEHRIDARFGGEYVIAWPRIERTLRGQIIEISETTLAYSWTFDHEPEIPPRVVLIHATGTERGTRIEIRHGPYRRDGSDAEERKGHLEGWEYFLPLLSRAIESES
jgi:uncharacterized protein YndB with AHSA1/START domain